MSNMPYQQPTTPLQKKLDELRRQAEERDAQRRAARGGVPYANLAKTPISIEAIKLIPEEEAKKAKAAAIERDANKVAVAALDPKAEAVSAIKKRFEDQGFEVRLFTASLPGLEQAWRLYEYVTAGVKNITGKVEIEKQHFEELLGKFPNLQAVKNEMESIRAARTSTTELLEVVLAGALSLKASDLHFEAEEKKARVRLRLDGLLHDVMEDLPPKNYENLVSRIKLLSGLKMNVHGEPQDGRFSINLPTKEVEVRVSIIPSEFGETIVMRLLDPDSINVDLAGLGLRDDDLVFVQEELKKPHGLILNTGPTGSGKTTTLYAFLKTLLSPEIKIITVEDPIEYRIEGVEQTQVNPEVGYTFAGGLRAILRQDPDAILVGEIRDKETADMAMQASLTGHIVLSTLHTNDAVGAVPRLVDLGVKPQTIGPALSLVIAQRLVRKLCPRCKKETPLSAAEKENIKKFLEALPERVAREKYKNFKVFESVGCDACSGLGYKGRVGIYEFFKGGPEMEEIILKDASQIALRKLADGQKMVSMQTDGVLKVLSGITSFDEVEDVAGKVAFLEKRPKKA